MFHSYIVFQTRKSPFLSGVPKNISYVQSSILVLDLQRTFVFSGSRKKMTCVTHPSKSGETRVNSCLLSRHTTVR